MSNSPIGNLRIASAKPELAPTLSAIALRSKAYWGYSDDFMRACRDELKVTASDISNPDWQVAVAMRADTPLGFYTLTPRDAVCWELHALFVEPDHIGHGIGAALFKHAIAWLKTVGATTLSIQSDPGAEGFYLSQGAIKVGETASGSIAGRFLPQLALPLAS